MLEPGDKHFTAEHAQRLNVMRLKENVILDQIGILGNDLRIAIEMAKRSNNDESLEPVYEILDQLFTLLKRHVDSPKLLDAIIIALGSEQEITDPLYFKLLIDMTDAQSITENIDSALTYLNAALQSPLLDTIVLLREKYRTH